MTIRRVLEQRGLPFGHHRYDVQLVEPLARLGEIVDQLPLQPCFGAASERFVEAQCHLWRNASLAAQEVGERLAADAEHDGPFGNVKVESFQTVLTNDCARVDEIGIGHRPNNNGESTPRQLTSGSCHFAGAARRQCNDRTQIRASCNRYTAEGGKAIRRQIAGL